LTAPGVPGPPGPGLTLSGAVAEYVDLPTDLGPSDNGAAYIVTSNGKLYVWDGTAWPALENGADFRGDTGLSGRGIASVSLQEQDQLHFAMSDNSTEIVTVPTITAAAASAAAAAASATAADTSADEANTSQLAAAASANGAATARDEAEDARDAAALSAGSAATSAGTADTAATNASASAVAANTSQLAAATSESNAASSATAAGTSATNAGNAATQAISARDGAVTASVNAEGHATNAANSAAAAQQSAEDAASVVLEGLPNATNTIKGGVRLPGGVAGELGGTWDHPTVTGWADKADLVGGKIPASQLPPVSTVETFVVADEAARLALTAQTGDIAVQTGNPGRGTYILQGADPAVSGDWVLMVNPTDAVSSVNGYQGVVVLSKADIGLSNVDNTSDANKPISTATQTALNGKANTSHVHSGADITTGTVPYARLPVGTSAGTVAAGDDARMTNARTPTAHTHSGADITSGTVPYANLPVGTTSNTVAAGNDARLSDARTPTAHVHSGADITSGTVPYARLPVGTAASTVAAGNDSRMTNQRVPTDSSVTDAKVAAGAAIALSKLAAGYVQGSSNGTPTTLTLWKGTQAQYDAIGSKDANTVYVVT